MLLYFFLYFSDIIFFLYTSLFSAMTTDGMFATRLPVPTLVMFVTTIYLLIYTYRL